ncbi:MAG: SMC-Scp complex subunit ScpB [Cyanobacteria bacterium]|nr:SMC-Scp complex subunit ScpB [Cyanobacteriota bacterium]MDA1021058.1 SMC-Scp complex subunit ScpB [Cyanobacteriota bacterium]
METSGYMNLNLNNSDLDSSSKDMLSKILPSSGFDFGISTGFDHIPSYEYTDINPRANAFAVDTVINEAKSSRLRDLKAKLEAILFLSDKPRGVDSLAIQAEADPNLVRDALIQLVQEYEARDGGLVIDTTDGYCMQISDQFESLTENILPIELRTAVLRTLSTIALKEPMLQSDLVKIRGGGVYEHVKELAEMGLVKKTKEGHSNIIHTTKYFQENFKLSQNGIELQTMLKSTGPTQVEFVRPGSLLANYEEESEEVDPAA